jgi:imidazolonepropionase-like amidohydrolase
MRTTLIFILAWAVLCGSADAQSIAITNATVYTSPDVTAQTHTTILIQHGKVAAVARNVVVPSGVRTLACQGCVVFAGFWNSHVHFTGALWAGADHLPAAQLSRDMRAMLTHSGFTTVVDTASDVSNTVVLRRRVQSAEVAGPRIYTAGFALFHHRVAMRACFHFIPLKHDAPGGPPGQGAPASFIVRFVARLIVSLTD